MNLKANSELRFWFELAEKLKRPVVELQLTMSSWEFTHWIALFKIRAEEEREARKKAELERRAKNPRRGF